MKTKSTRFATGVLTVALTLATLTAVRAQTRETNSPAAGDAVKAEKEPDIFRFPGGSPRDLLQQIEKEYKVDWLSVADIPREMDSVRVPQFRISFEREQVSGQPRQRPVS